MRDAIGGVGAAGVRRLMCGSTTSVLESPGAAVAASPHPATPLPVSEPEMMILDEDRRVRWMNRAKRLRLGGALAEAVLGCLCEETRALCANTCECCLVPRGEAVRRPFSHWVTPRDSGQPLRVEVVPFALPGGRRGAVIRHHPLKPSVPGPSPDSGHRSAIWAAMATLTAGLAHELRNPLCALDLRLTAIRGRDTYGLNERGRAALDEVAATLRRLASVVDRLTSFRPAEPLSARPVALAELVRRSLATQAEALRGVEVSVEDRHPEPAFADPPRLVQALDALIENAAQAMAGEGCLTITLTAGESWSQITVADSGPGIPPEVRARLGEPFVTTKPPGQGAGLGLSLCQLIADRHGGQLRLVHSGPDGTTMRLLLPRHHSREAALA